MVISLEFYTPNYDIGIFRVLPTLLSESFKIELDYPYSDWILKNREYRSKFQETDLSIFLIIDSLCLDLLEGYLKKLWMESGELTLSSIAPTTTANAVGSIYIGLPPEISGLIAMRFYVPEIGNFVNALHGKVSRQGSRDSLAAVGVKLSSFLWHPSVLDTIGGDDFVVIDLLPDKIYGGLSRFYEENIIRLHYSTELDTVYEVRDISRKFISHKKRGIIFVYFSELDSIGHKYGKKSLEWKNELSLLNNVVEEIVSIVKSLGERVNVVILSDHGHVEVRHHVEIDEDDWKKFSSEMGILEYMSSERFGFIYLQEDTGGIDLEKIENFFDNRVKVLTVEEAIRKNFWPALNEEYLEAFLSRAGDLVLVADKGIELEFKRKNKTVDDFLYGLGNEYRKYRGGHGGLTKDEMIIPLIVLNTGE